MSSRKLLYRLYQALWLGIDLLLPPTCGGCGAAGYRWCPRCQQRAERLRPPLCETCGNPVSGGRLRCAACVALPPHFKQLRSWAVFDDPVRPALHRLKYRRDMGLGEALVPALIQLLAGQSWPLDAVVPVPLGAGRLRERGYNQSALISWPLALGLGIAHVPGAVFRTRETPTQVGLNRVQRRENVHGAFQAKLRLTRGRTILVVDDVATSGATLSSCAEALYAAEARDVFALTVARAIRGPAADV